MAKRQRKNPEAAGPGKQLRPADDDAWAAPLVYPGEGVGFGGMVQAFGMLLLCRSRAERLLVGLCVWRGEPAARGAAAAGLTPRQASDVLASLRRRVEAGGRRSVREAELAAMADATRPRPAWKRRTRPLHMELHDASDLDEEG